MSYHGSMTLRTATIEHRPEPLDGASLALTTFEREIQRVAREFAEQVEAYLAEVASSDGRTKCSVSVQHLGAEEPAPARQAGLDLALATAECWARIVLAPAPADERRVQLRRVLGRGRLAGSGRLDRSLGLRRIWPAYLPLARPPPGLRDQGWLGGLLAMLSSQLAKGRFAAPTTKR